MQVRGGFTSDVGTTRDINQDDIIFCQYEKNGKNFALGVMCDGIGGMQHGEIASKLVCRGLQEWFENVVSWIDMEKMNEKVLYAHLKDTVETLNQQVLDIYLNDKIRTGTTMSLIMIFRSKYYIIQVGDSRIYRYNKKLLQLTKDATLIDNSGEKAKQYLTNFMGKNEETFFTSSQGKLSNGDIFIFCSDGFYHKFVENDLQEFVWTQDEKEINEKCVKLVNYMKSRGERDNISVGIIKISDTNSFLNNIFKHKKKRN